MKTKLLYMTAALGMMLGLASCDLNYFPSDELNGEVLMSNESGAKYLLDGCYTMMKEEYAYMDPYESGNTYVRHFFQMAEFPADNTCLSWRTTDHLYEATCYKTRDNLYNIHHIWWIGYKIIFNANTVIDGFKEGESATYDQLIGEAYFLRAMVHFHLVNLFARQYAIDKNAPGIPLRTKAGVEIKTRATVAEVYDQIVKDLIKAAELMNQSRGNAGYATKEAAQGLLSRVYLYMGENQKVLDVIKEMGDPTAHLDPNFPAYFANALTSKETLFAVAHTSLENKGGGSIGSMYNGDGGGWGEVYPSDPLLNLYERYPQDVRYTGYIKLQEETDPKLNPLYGKSVVVFPTKGEEGEDYRANQWAELKTDASGKYCEIDGTKYRVKEKLVNGEYTEYYVTYAGEDCAARCYDVCPANRHWYPKLYVTKFGYQDGLPQLSSPVFLRWGEIVLNRAEANAKLGNTAAALADVDAIRARAGIPAAGMFSGNMHGYDNVLDIVLDERRMELAFEGHRMFDVYRNLRNMNREYPGVHPWEIVPYTADKILYPIPYGEWSVSGIEQNPGY